MYKNILLTVDLNDEHSWKKALPTSVEIRKAFGSALHIATIVPDFGYGAVSQFFDADYQEKLVHAADQDLRAFVKANVPAGILARHIVGCGRIYEEILRIARDIKCDLIVMASHRPELKDYLLGPNAARVVRHADCSVLVVREDEAG